MNVLISTGVFVFHLARPPAVAQDMVVEFLSWEAS